MNGNYDNRYKAKLLFWQGWKITSIAKELKTPPQTIYSWKRRDDWEGTPEIKRVEASLDARLQELIAKPFKTNAELHEIKVLIDALKSTAEVRAYDRSEKPSDLHPKLKERGKRKTEKQGKNYLTQEDIEQLVEAFEGSLYKYQKVWYRNRGQRNRNILKSRQIGATWYFAREAIIDAILTGDNQVFLSASKAQAHIFKLYILAFVKEVTGVDLTGDPITLWNGATLYFLGTNAKTAQGYHGHVYMDEYFWIGRFQEFRKVASAMAMHKKWRRTYFSTPSAMSHEAYPFWTGELANRGRPKNQKLSINVSHKKLKNGRLCEDGMWRHMVTVEDAVEQGCDLFDLDELRLEYSPDEHDNLLMCRFIDDTASIFTMAQMQPCMVDSWVIWEDVKFLAPKPFASRPVWIGYDPARTKDDAAIVVLAPSSTEGGKHRIIDKILLQNMPFDYQAERIRKLCKIYNVEHIGIDITGIGYGVYDLVRRFFPAAKAIKYSPAVKTRLVLKAQSVINNGRLEFDSIHKDIAGAFMSIRKTTTPSGNQVTYEAVRTEESGHGDSAWAIMHALDKEQLTGVGGETRSGSMEIC